MNVQLGDEYRYFFFFFSFSYLVAVTMKFKQTLFRIAFWEEGKEKRMPNAPHIFFPFPLFYMKPNTYYSVIFFLFFSFYFLVNLFDYSLQIRILYLKTYLCLLSQNSAGEEKLKLKGYFGNCGWN